MSSKPWTGKSLQQRAKDILEAIAGIRAYISGCTFDDFSGDRKTVSAVERELLTISEACAKLLELEVQLAYDERDRLERRFPAVPWHRIRGIGNVLRHEYGRVDHATLWDTIAGRDDLSALEKAIHAAVPDLR